MTESGRPRIKETVSKKFRFILMVSSFDEPHDPVFCYFGLSSSLKDIEPAIKKASSFFNGLVEILSESVSIQSSIHFHRSDFNRQTEFISSELFQTSNPGHRDVFFNISLSRPLFGFIFPFSWNIVSLKLIIFTM